METYIVVGHPGSPYTRKVLSAFRYRRLPHRFIIRGSSSDTNLPTPAGPALIPNVAVMRGHSIVRVLGDSTFILKEFDDYAFERRLNPRSERLRFLCDLLEDFCDEYLTKAMYFYRWGFARDAAKAATWVGTMHAVNAEEGVVKDVSREFSKRQIDRLPVVVGNNLKDSKLEIEDFYVRFLRLLDDHLKAGFMFLLGDRPCAADFAAFGQLVQLIQVDSTSNQIAENVSVRVQAWVAMMEDLSGIEVKDNGFDCVIQNDALVPTLVNIFREMGRSYVPYMLANAKAFNHGVKEFQYVDASGRTQVFNTFKYQVKCVTWLRKSFNALGTNDQAWINRQLHGTGCEPLLHADIGEKVTAKI